MNNKYKKCIFQSYKVYTTKVGWFPDLFSPLQGLGLSQGLAGLLSCFAACQNIVATSCFFLFDESSAVLADVVNNRTRQVRFDRLGLHFFVAQLHFANDMSVSLVSRMMVTAAPAPAQDICIPNGFHIDSLSGRMFLFGIIQ